MKLTYASAFLLPLVAKAYPAVSSEMMAENSFMKRAAAARPDSTYAKRAAGEDPLQISKSQTNCGPTPCLIFDETEQFVSTTGEYAYASPGTADIRGPCPGLNAAANHGYLPRDGIASIEETISGLGAAYGLSADANAFLAAYAIALDGNIIQMVWSIGGPLPHDPSVQLLGAGQGLSYSHNNYEGDSSIGRMDAYINHGDAHSLSVQKFTEVYHVGGKENRYTLDKFRSRFKETQDYSIAHNPYYFTGAFSTIAVVPAAYNFVINLMSNHSADEPNGYLDGKVFKSFFAISGKPGNFQWNKGQERIPNNWYRRPSAVQYTANDIGEDVGIGYAAYPNTLKIGGNTGKPNSYVGVSVAKVTGGSLNVGNLFKGDNFQCFTFALAQNAIPSFLKGPLGQVNKAKGILGKALTPITSKLDCPELGDMDQGLFNQFPGRNYKPKGKATNY